MTAERRQQAEEVLFTLNPNYIGVECCVFCGLRCSMWASAAMNPDGDRKGICPRCERTQFMAIHECRQHDAMCLDRIRNGFYD